MTWTCFGFLSILGALIPLLEPRVPLVGYDKLMDGETVKVMALEDSASILSRITFSFMDYIVYRAYRAKDVVLADLPEVPSKQRAIYLARRAFRVRTMLWF